MHVSTCRQVHPQDCYNDVAMNLTFRNVDQRENAFHVIGGCAVAASFKAKLQEQLIKYACESQVIALAIIFQTSDVDSNRIGLAKKVKTALDEKSCNGIAALSGDEKLKILVDCAAEVGASKGKEDG